MGKHVTMHVKRGDTVVVTAGKEKGKSGKILKVNTKKSSVVIEKVNFIKRHSRPSSKAPQGGIIEKEGPVNVTNVNVLCAKCNRPVRIKMKLLDDGKKVRACLKCGEIIDR